MIVLAINPGSRYLGIAVMQGTVLKDWRVKVLQGTSLKEKSEKAQSILLAFVQRYEPTALAMKKLSSCRCSKHLSLVVQALSVTAEENGLRVYRYPIGRLEYHFSPTRKINKQEMAEIIAAQYPDLSYELSREKTSKNSYHIRLFEAVALAALCAHQLDNI